MEKKVIKTRKELEMERKAQEGVKTEKTKTEEEIPVETEETKETATETETETPDTETTSMEKSLEKGRNTAQKIFEDMINTFRDKQGDFEKAMTEYTASSTKIPMDVIETDTNIIIKTDLPGVKKEDIVIDLSEDMLEVMAIFEDESEFKGETFVKKERRYGEAKRSVTINKPIKIEEASAKFDNGVLTVTIPKEEKRRHQLKLD